MNDDVAKTVCLIDELDISYKLIVAGLGDLQEIDFANNFYHLPHQSLASGIERYLKCYICLVYEARNSKFPDKSFMLEIGHDLSKLCEKIYCDYFSHNDIPALSDDYLFLKTDATLKRIIAVLSEFGKHARYYNLDVMTGEKKPPINPNEAWSELERSVEDDANYLLDIEALYTEYYPRVHSKIISKIEQFIRAIARQFTLGNHGGNLSRFSTTFYSFLTLRDDKLGTTDYRRSVKILRSRQDTWEKRTEKEVLNSKWPTMAINRESYSGEWPFRFDKVILECRDEIFAIINIEGYDFSLNGSAASRYKYPFPQDAGIAILGKSIAPFFDIAFDLGRKSR